MQKFIFTYSRILFIGSFISLITLLAIIVHKYGHSGRQGFELNIVLYSLSVYAVVVPIILYILNLLTFRGILSGLLFTILLSLELFLWVILFHGLKALPALKELSYFCIPVGLFLITTILCFLFTSHKNFQQE